jgi:hypothetical protein
MLVLYSCILKYSQNIVDSTSKKRDFPPPAVAPALHKATQGCCKAMAMSVACGYCPGINPTLYFRRSSRPRIASKAKTQYLKEQNSFTFRPLFLLGTRA